MSIFVFGHEPLLSGRYLVMFFFSVYLEQISLHCKPPSMHIQYSRKVLEQDEKSCYCQFIVSFIKNYSHICSSFVRST